MKHDEKPTQADAPHPGSLGAIKQILASTYYQSLQGLLPAVRGEVVVGSLAGTSGFLLFFANGLRAVSYLSACSPSRGRPRGCCATSLVVAPESAADPSHFAKASIRVWSCSGPNRPTSPLT
jgi:hypothetical protein